MSYTLSYNAQLHFIVLTVKGDFTVADINEWTVAALRLGAVKGCDLYLSDYRDAKVKLTTLDIHQLPESLTEIYSAQQADIHRVKRALVVSRDIEDYRFFENVAANRGQPVRVFTDIDEATRWLVGPTTAASPPQS